MTLLLAKLLLAPLLVVWASLAGRRWGQSLSGILVALPLVAGPILLIADAEHGVRFAAHAAGASLLGLAALAAFVVVFGRMSRSGGWFIALATGWIVYLALALAFSTVAPVPAIGLALATGAFGLAGRFTRGGAQFAHVRDPDWPAWDIPARAVTTAALVLAVTGLSPALGPALTGVLAPFPIAMSVLAAFVLAQHGPAHVEALLKGFLRGALGFAVFCFLVSILLQPTGTPAAFAIGLLGAVFVQLLSQLARRPSSSTQSA